MDYVSAIAESNLSCIEKIKRKESLIGVVGLGYVGLPLIMGFNRIGFPTIGIDIDEQKIVALKNGQSYIQHFSDLMIAELNDSGRFHVSSDFNCLESADVILLCVPTPLSKHREPDLSYVIETAESIAPYLRQGQLIVLESTTYPGTTREVLEPILERGSGLQADKHFHVAYSPEREDPGNPNFDTSTIPKVIGASTDEGQTLAAALYSSLVQNVVQVSTPETAEAVKLTENIFRAVNIALVNELKLIYEEMGIDVWEVIDAAATKPFGFMPFYPGPGLGGHCIPIDPFYLTWKAREFGFHTRFIELAGEINRNMPRHVITKLSDALSLKEKKALNGARILVVGIAYKKNVDDIRESPALVIMNHLADQGTEFAYYDPHVKIVPQTREFAQFTGMKSIEWTADNLRLYDAALIITDHDDLDWNLLVEHSKLILDTRNVLKNWQDDFCDKIVRA